MPAFYTVRSGQRLDHFTGTPDDTAAILRRHWRELDGGGVLIANPIPAEASLDERLISGAIEDALRTARTTNITGKALTPHLLAQLNDATNGASVRANQALARSNARVAAEIALALGAYV
jgi:pseudouridine-5'-phosphate glycosidase